MPKIAALYIDKTYAIYHSISVLIELAIDNRNDVFILTRVQNKEIIENMLSKFNCKKITVIILRPYWYFPLSHYFEIKLQLRTILYYKYRKLFNSFDAIICNMYGDLELKNIITIEKNKLVFANHGVSNRAYSFDKKIQAFEMFFIVGQNELDIREKHGQLTHTNYALIGYPKLDVTTSTPILSFFPNNNPTIVYNPHWLPNLSSYFKFGIDVLDYFANNKNYNLIFAPHSLLYARNKFFLNKTKKYNAHDNILIDLGSESSNDMTYMKTADIYLGDISSQALEFLLIKPRPCLYLDAHNLADDKQNIFLSWQFGKVINTMNNFKKELEMAINNHETEFLDKQNQKISDMFYKSGESASVLGAKAIMNLLSAP